MLGKGQFLQGRYRIDKELGQGGMGAVYLANDTYSPGLRCAIKEHRPDSTTNLQTLAQLRQQFKVEADTLKRLNHANLPKVFDYFSEGGSEYIVMEYIEGDDLENLLQKQGGPLQENSVLFWADQLLDALHHLHSQLPPIIHRDIKPSNIIVTLQGQAKLVDFGLVKLLDPNNPHTKSVMKGMGTLEYTPLEQYGTVQGHTDGRTDIYALGATLYHLLTNVEPPSAVSRSIGSTNLSPLRQHNPSLTLGTEAAILKAMAVQPDHRYQSAQDFRAALAGYQSYVPVYTTQQVGPVSPPLPIPVNNPTLSKWLMGLIAVALFLLVIAVSWVGMMLSGLTPSITGISPPLPTSIPPAPIVTNTPIPSVPVALIETPTDTPPSEPVEDPVREPSNTPTPRCTHGFTFMEDLTIPDGTPIEAGQTFVKIWRVRNNGTCAWDSSQSIRFLEGQQLGPQSAPVPAIEPGEEANISMEMTAPTRSGEYYGTWDLIDANGSPFGHLMVSIYVPGAPTAIPTAPSIPSPIPPAPTSDSSDGGGSYSGTRLAFVSDRNGNKDIYTMNADGSDLYRLTNSNADDKKPVWSPDGSRIAFESWRDGNSEIYVMNADGSNQIRLTNGIANDEWPAWSSTGQLVFHSNRTNKWNMFLMNSDGSSQWNLTDSLSHEIQPAWSPNGRLIAFIFRESSDQPWNIYRMNADNSGWLRLTNNATDTIQPAWSPNGRLIVFASPPKRGDNFDVYIMNADGSGLRNLTNHPEYDFQPSWTPDGYITFVSYRDGNHEIYIMDTDGSGLRRLTNHTASDQWPAWRP